MYFLSEILHDTTIIIKSDSAKKRIELQRLYINLERKTEKQPEHLILMDIARKLILASCNILFNDIRIEVDTQPHTTS